MTIKEREKLLKNMVNKKQIHNTDIPLYRFLLGLFAKGADYDKVWVWTKTPWADYKKWWRNLALNGYFEGKKIVVESNWPKNSAIEFHLMACVARGLIKRKLEEGKPI